MLDLANVNPFDITKATEFTDQQIAEYFVEMPGGSITTLANPRSPVPMIIQGGKGSGKTHLMRYFSYPLQKVRHAENTANKIKDDGYIGVYFRCGGLNAERFRNKGQTSDAWKAIFAYYMELWFGQLVLAICSDFIGLANESKENEANATRECISLFDDTSKFEGAGSLLGLAEKLHAAQKQMDVEINNCALTGTLDVRIRATSGRLVFGIPQTLQKHFDCVSRLQFLYLIDEFENLMEAQQRYVNTLLREKELPCSFKIGGRLYGFKTFKTYSDEEEIKEGSEYEVLPLDARLRDHKNYRQFAENLCAKRLGQAGLAPRDADMPLVIETLARLFETPLDSRLYEEQTQFIHEKYADRDRPYFTKLRDKVKQGIAQNSVAGVRSDQDLEVIVSNLKCADHPILEKLNIFILYKDWRKSKDLVQNSADIRTKCEAFLSGGEGEQYGDLLEKRKGDLLAQLLRECDRKQQYLGFDTFVGMSEGLPRNLLVLLKSVVNWSAFNGEQPFKGGKISIDSQREGVREAADWFFDDARTPGSDGTLIRAGVARLATLFRDIRFSDKPSEKAIYTFSADLSQCSPEAQRIVNLAEKWSLLIRVQGGQKDRNSKRVDEKYFINSILSPKWDLPVSRGGALELDPKQVNAIFDPNYISQFDELSRERVSRMTAPLFGARSKHQGQDVQMQSLLPLEPDHA